jgi:hypothetical protein
LSKITNSFHNFEQQKRAEIMIKFFFVIILLCTTVFLGAQGTVPKNQRQPTTKTKKITGNVPKVKAFWGKFSAGTYNQTILSTLLDSANLYLVDEKGVAYTPIKYSFSFKQRREYTDEVTEQKLVTYDYLTNDLKNGQNLDTLWRSRVKEDMKDGDEIIFENILADSKRGFAVRVESIKFVVNGNKAQLFND